MRGEDWLKLGLDILEKVIILPYEIMEGEHSIVVSRDPIFKNFLSFFFLKKV